MRAKDESPGLGWLLPLAVGGFGLVAIGCILDVARMVSQVGPRVGDMITFRADAHPDTADGTRVAVTRTDGGKCLLDVPVMQRGGGSIIVEERSGGFVGTYRVHWSGATTSEAASDCGRSADLVLQSTDMSVLAHAAGGYGVGRNRLVMSTPMARAGSGVP